MKGKRQEKFHTSPTCLEVTVNQPIFSRFLKVGFRACVFQQEYSPLGVCTFLILSQNTWYKGRALISFGFEMSAMTLSGSQAKDRDWSFGVHSSKASLGSVGQRKKKLNKYSISIKKGFQHAGLKCSHWNKQPVGVMSYEAGSDTTAPLFFVSMVVAMVSPLQLMKSCMPLLKNNYSSMHKAHSLQR